MNSAIAKLYYIQTSHSGVLDSIPGRGVVADHTTLSPQYMMVRDARHEESSFSTKGFALLSHEYESHVSSLGEQIEQEVYPEVETIAGEALDALRVVAFGYVRRHSAGRLKDFHEQGPVRVVHADETPEDNRQTVEKVISRKKLPQTFAELPFSILHLWRPLAPVERDPLALCDASTVTPQDIHITRLHYPKQVKRYSLFSHNKNHRWWYFSNMTPAESIVFSCFDSRKPYKGLVPHASFIHPATAIDAPARESIEIRLLAFWKP